VGARTASQVDVHVYSVFVFHHPRLATLVSRAISDFENRPLFHFCLAQSLDEFFNAGENGSEIVPLLPHFHCTAREKSLFSAIEFELQFLASSIILVA
jgi:hypothetical protein